MTSAEQQRAQRQVLHAIGERVRQHRLSMGLSQEGFADRAALHRTYISGIERGERNVSVLNLVKVADALDVDPGALLQGLSLG